MKNKKQTILFASLLISMMAAFPIVMLVAHYSGARALSKPAVVAVNPNELLEITQTNYEAVVTNETTPLGVLFVRGDCQICKDAESVVLALSQQYAGRLKFVKVDILKSPTVASDFGVKIEPAIIVADPKTHAIAGMSQGVPDPGQLSQFLDLALTRIKN